MVVLDRILVTTYLESRYPLINLRADSRAGSYHLPLIVNFCLYTPRKPKLFRFEKWLERRGYLDLVNKEWNAPCNFTSPMDIWQYKIGLLTKKNRGWAINADAEVRKRKQSLIAEYDQLDLLYEQGQATDKRDNMIITLEWLNNIWNLEEMKARQRSQDREVKVIGILPTFRQLANQRKRKRTIPVLEGPFGLVDQTNDMLKVAVDFYKNLFGGEPDPQVNFRPNFWEEQDKLTESEKDIHDAFL